MDELFTKLKITQLVSKYTNGFVHRLHIMSVINIFIDEMIIELKNFSNIKITGLGTFSIVELKPKRIRSVVSGEIKFAAKTKSLRFTLDRKLERFLLAKKIVDLTNCLKK